MQVAKRHDPVPGMRMKKPAQRRASFQNQRHFIERRLDFLFDRAHGSAMEPLYLVVGAIGFEPTTL